MNSINWGIIGCGQVTERKSGPAFQAIEGSHLQAVMRRNLTKAKDYAHRHNIPFATNRADDIIKNKDINAVYIATPPAYHYEYANRCMKAGKAVYVEKPMALSYAHCLDMTRISEQTNQPLFVAYYRRSLAYFNTIKNLLDQNRIGKPVSVILQLHKPLSKADVSKPKPWRVIPDISGGGYFFDLACHEIDILNYFFGMPESFEGSASNHAGTYQAEDRVQGIIHYPENIVVDGSWDFCVPESKQIDRCTITATKGKITFSFFDFTAIEVCTTERNEVLQIKRPVTIQKEYIQSIVNELLGKGKCPGSLESATVTTQIMLAMTDNYYNS